MKLNIVKVLNHFLSTDCPVGFFNAVLKLFIFVSIG